MTDNQVLTEVSTRTFSTRRFCKLLITSILSATTGGELYGLRCPIRLGMTKGEAEKYGPKGMPRELEAAGDAQLLDFVGVTAGRSGVDCDLEIFTTGIENAYEVLFVGFRRTVGYLEGAGRIAAEEIAEYLPGLGLGAVAGRRQYGKVQIIREPAGEGRHIPGCKVFGN